MTQVALVQCPDYDTTRVSDALDRALEPFGGLLGAGGFNKSISAGSRVLVKPNFLRAAPAERAV
ncbi:MAG TPA: (4Fe-4S)-binding protein, partial [Deltaproteobacteria bacterium]|nr:(4Fe-4S)-binding protein [Deltaproteobacteria bacterium]